MPTTTKKGNHTNNTTDTSDNTQTPMLQTTSSPSTINTSVVSPLKGKLIVEPTQRGKGFNLTAHLHEGWDMSTDLYVGANAGSKANGHNLKVRDAAIEGLSDFAAGNIRGTGYFFVVIPDNKIEAACSLSTLGYVFSDCPEGQKIVTAGGVVVTPPAFRFPRNGVLRIRQDGMGGSVWSDDDFIYPGKVNQAGYADDWGYYHALVIRQLLSGGNVGVLLNSITLKDAYTIQAVAESSDPVQANWDRKNANRDAAAANREVRAIQAETEFIAEVTGVTPVITAEQLIVTGYSKSTKVEQPVDMLLWNKPVFYITEDGRELANGYFWKAKTMDALKAEKLSIVTMMNNNGYRLSLP